MRRLWSFWRRNLGPSPYNKQMTGRSPWHSRVRRLSLNWGRTSEIRGIWGIRARNRRWVEQKKERSCSGRHLALEKLKTKNKDCNPSLTSKPTSSFRSNMIFHLWSCRPLRVLSKQTSKMQLNLDLHRLNSSMKTLEILHTPKKVMCLLK